MRTYPWVGIFKKVKWQDNTEVIQCGWNTEPMMGVGKWTTEGHVGKIDCGDFIKSLECWLERFVLILNYI